MAEAPAATNVAGARTRARPFTEADQGRLRDLHGEGLSVRRIAERLGRDPGTVSRWAKRLGLAFDRAPTAAATAARQVDLAAERTQVGADLLADVQRVRGLLWGPRDPGGPPPTLRDVRDGYAAIRDAMGTHLKVAEHDRGGENLSAVDSWLASMMGAPAAEAAPWPDSR